MKLLWSEIFSSYPSPTKYEPSSSHCCFSPGWWPQTLFSLLWLQCYSNLSFTFLFHFKTLQNLSPPTDFSFLPASPSLTAISSCLVHETWAAFHHWFFSLTVYAISHSSCCCSCSQCLKNAKAFPSINDIIIIIWIKIWHIYTMEY